MNQLTGWEVGGGDHFVAFAGAFLGGGRSGILRATYLLAFCRELIPTCHGFPSTGELFGFHLNEPKQFLSGPTKWYEFTFG